MKFDFLRNKVFIISFIVLILFSFFSCNVFASPLIDVNYDYNYSYNIISNDYVKNIEGSVLKDDRIVSGDYYYFISYNYGNRSYDCYLIKKSFLSSSSYSMKIANWGEAGYQGFFIYFNTEDYVVFYGKDCVSKMADGIGFGLFGLLNSDDKSFSFPFATNFDKSIVLNFSNGTTKDFFVGAPTFHLVELNTVGQIPQIMMKIIKVLLPVGLIVLSCGLLIYLIKRVIYSMK